MAERGTKSMANEKKVNETKQLIVKREAFGKSEEGNDLYSYFIEAVFRGQKQRISLAPQDNGAYSLLNIIYNDCDVANARIVEGTYTPEGSTEAIVTLSVEVFVIDEGIEFACPLKPQRSSDKACLKIQHELLKAAKVA